MVKRKKEKQITHKINQQIRSTEVRLVGEIENSGSIVSLKDALNMANEMELDLVEINDKTTPSICKLVIYNKFLYDLKKQKKELLKKQKENSQEIKEIRFGPNTDIHDYNFKLKHAESFLVKNDIVKAFVFFKGREIQFKEKGEIILLRLANDLCDLGVPDNVKPKLEGKKMIMFIRPKKK